VPRTKGGVVTRRRHNKILKLTKGQYGSRGTLWRRSNEAMLKSLSYAYRDRRDRKGDMRRLWIVRINAAAREHGMNYNQFMHGLSLAGVELNRKSLSELAVRDPEAFSKLAATAAAASNA